MKRRERLGEGMMKVKDLKAQLETFRRELREHFELWCQSLDQPIPDYPVRNVARLNMQMDSLARRLGLLRPYIERFGGQTVLRVPAIGVEWDAYDSAVSNDVAQRKGPSIEAILSQIQQILGRLDGLVGEDDMEGKNRTPRGPAPRVGSYVGGGVQQVFHGPVTIHSQQIAAAEQAVQSLSQTDPGIGSDLAAIARLLQQSEDLRRRDVREALKAIEALSHELEQKVQDRKWQSILDYAAKLTTVAKAATDVYALITPHLAGVERLVSQAGAFLKLG
jgi:hypothetical protein